MASTCHALRLEFYFYLDKKPAAHLPGLPLLLNDGGQWWTEFISLKFWVIHTSHGPISITSFPNEYLLIIILMCGIYVFRGLI